MSDLERLQQIADLAWDALKAELQRVDVCIAATRVALEVLAPLGYEVKPLPVRVFGYNQKWVELSMERGHFPRSDAEKNEWVSEGGWSVGAGIGHRTDRNVPYGRNERLGRFNGHLVLVVNRDYLLDLSVAQMARPDHQMFLDRPLVVPIPERAFLHGTKRLFAEYRMDDHPVVTFEYEAVPSDRTFTRTSDWTVNVQSWKRLAQGVRAQL